MNIYFTIFIFFLALLFIYWLYKKYRNNKVYDLKMAIKNNITITMYNMNKFLNLSTKIKNELIPLAIKYKHEDIINLLKI
jgi:hypothetical protein